MGYIYIWDSPVIDLVIPIWIYVICGIPMRYPNILYVGFFVGVPILHGFILIHN